MHDAHDDHAHDHHADHSHGSDMSPIEARVRALETVLTQKGYIDPKALDVLIDTYENKIGPRNGAQVVARAWSDLAYKARLLADATAAVAEFGFTGRQGEHMVAVENTATVHNLIVCTLCSCYPLPLLGLPPVWYKSAPYRSRAVLDPRGVLADFGVAVPAGRELRIWIRPPKSAISCSPSGPPAPTAGRPSGWRRWSRATA